MNNLIKNVAIWLVIALVLMTVFNQFSTRQTAQKAMEYSQFIEEVKQGNVAKVTIEGRVLKGVKTQRRALHHLFAVRSRGWSPTCSRTA